MGELCSHNVVTHTLRKHNKPQYLKNNNNQKINALTPSDRANSLRAFFLFGRKYPHFWGFIQTNVSFPDMFESVNVFSDILDF